MPDVELLGSATSTATLTFKAVPGPLELLGSATSMAMLTMPPRGKRWRVVVTDVNGTTLGELPYAVLGPISYELNKPEQFSFTLLQNDPGIELLAGTPFREIQVWRGDQILAWGPITRMAYSKGTFAATCQGAMWHLTRRYIGKANRHNYVSNGSFEDGVAGGWGYFETPIANFYGLANSQGEVGPAAEAVTFPVVEGRKSLALVNTVPGADAFGLQHVVWTVDGTADPEGDLFTLKGYLLVSERIPEGQGAYENRGLFLGRGSTTQLDPRDYVQTAAPGAVLGLEYTFIPLDEDTPVGVWKRFEIELTSPPKAGESELLEVRLYAPAGITVYWDAVSLTRVEKLSFYGVDQVLIARGIVEHLQDADYDKSDVNISTYTPLSGVLRTRVYVHSEHPPGPVALEEFPKLGNGFDYAVLYTPTERIFTTFYPRRGVYKPTYPLALPASDGSGNIADWTWSFDGEAASSSIIVLGSGEGSDREEGGAVDASAWADGVTMEEVFVAPDGTPIDALGSMAQERLIVAKNPINLELTLLPNRTPDPIGAIWPGDDLPVTIDRHALNINGTYRVVHVTVNPDSGAMDLTLNLRVAA